MLRLSNSLAKLPELFLNWRMSTSRFCFSMCDTLNQSKSAFDPFQDHWNTLSIISYNLGVFVVQVAIFLYFSAPFFFRYSLWLRRHILFTHSVSLNIFPWRDYFKPLTHGIHGGRGFHLTTFNKNASRDFRIGVWHILPKSLVKASESQSSKYWDEALRTSGKPVFLYFHGSIGTRGTWHRIALYKILQALDYHVVTFDYRGFGDSTPVLPSETRAVEDGRIVHNWIRETIGENALSVPIFFWAHSMGTGVACHLASALENLNSTETASSPSGLILEAPFTNLKEEIRVYFISYLYNIYPYLFDWFFVTPLEETDMLFESDRHIHNIRIPVLILHAVNDPVVPYRLGKKLYDIAWKARSKKWHPIHFKKFTEFGIHTSHSHICRSPRIPKLLHTFKESCQRAANL